MEKRGNYFALASKIILVFIVLFVFVIVITDNSNNETQIVEENDVEEEIMSAQPESVNENTQQEPDEDIPKNIPLNRIKLLNRQELTVEEFKKVKDDIPSEIIEVADNYIESFVDEENLEKDFRFEGIVVYTNPQKTLAEYVVVYDYEIVSYRENDKKTISNYAIKVHLDQDGNIIDKTGPRDWFIYLKERGE